MATKLPAAMPTARGVLAAPEPSGPAAPPGSGTFKLLVWVLVVLNVAVAGGWTWFRFFRNADSRRALNTTRHRLVTLKTNLDQLGGTVRGIIQGRVSEVEDPGTLAAQVATALEIREYINIERKSIVPGFLKTNYTETSVPITFLNQRVFKFDAVVRFLTALELANPTVQIKMIDFGKRVPATVGSDAWVPRTATVRTLQLTSQDS